MKIEEIIEQNQNGIVLFLGRVTKLSDELLALMGENILINEVVELLIGINRVLDYKLASTQVA